MSHKPLSIQLIETSVDCWWNIFEMIGLGFLLFILLFILFIFLGILLVN